MSEKLSKKPNHREMYEKRIESLEADNKLLEKTLDGMEEAIYDDFIRDDEKEEEIAKLEKQLKEWDEERVPRLHLVGVLIRNDWSGNEFDGRDIQDWIDLILGGKYEEFDDDVKPYAEDYNLYLYDEIIKRKEKTPPTTSTSRE